MPIGWRGFAASPWGLPITTYNTLYDEAGGRVPAHLPCIASCALLRTRSGAWGATAPHRGLGGYCPPAVFRGRGSLRWVAPASSYIVLYVVMGSGAEPRGIRPSGSFGFVAGVRGRRWRGVLAGVFETA